MKRGGCSIKEVMVFYPSEEEFNDFNKYIEYIESQGANKIGIAKIVPPPSWIPRRDGNEGVEVTISTPIKQCIEGSQGKYQCTNFPQPPLSLKDFEALANSTEYRPPDELKDDPDALERKFWKNVAFNPPIYGADVPYSLFDSDQHLWNPACLHSLLDHVVEDYHTTIEGVTTPYLYFGMWRSTFAWHTEDMDLYSINYLHFGAPKFWYCIPPAASRKFERLVAAYYPVESKECSNFLRHKSTLISPSILKLNNIPFTRVHQHPRDIIITFPFAYHSGFNTGFNCAESTNFASMRWLEYGKRAIQCDCRKGMVRFSMKCFVKRYQAHLYPLFLNNLDLAPHPEDTAENAKVVRQQVYGDHDYIITDKEDMQSRRLISKRVPFKDADEEQKINEDDDDGGDDIPTGDADDSYFSFLHNDDNSNVNNDDTKHVNNNKYDNNDNMPTATVTSTKLTFVKRIASKRAATSKEHSKLEEEDGGGHDTYCGVTTDNENDDDDDGYRCDDDDDESEDIEYGGCRFKMSYKKKRRKLIQKISKTEK